jgi:hypothetical protein
MNTLEVLSMQADYWSVEKMLLAREELYTGNC